MVTLGIGRTQTLVTHVGRWCGAIFADSGYLYGAGVVQNMAIFWVKIKPLWWAGSRVGIQPGKCLVCHITPQCMEQLYLGPLLPSPGTNPGVQNMAIFWVKIRPLWRAGSRVRIPSGKGFMCHITPQ